MTDPWWRRPCEVCGKPCLIKVMEEQTDVYCLNCKPDSNIALLVENMLLLVEPFPEA